MLPDSLLQAALGKPMLVELKNGETFNGHLSGADNFMNLTLKEVYQTSANGDQFWKLPECYLKGHMIKYVRVADNVLDTVKEQEAEFRARASTRGKRPTGPVQGTRGGRGGAAQRGRG
ncbi:uncharacterized protein L969DRAFT_61761, partial [Mixia osmundae IAM 14324]